MFAYMQLQIFMKVNFINKKVRGGALPLVITVLTIISLFISALYILIDHENRLINNWIQKDKNHRLLVSAVNILLMDQESPSEMMRYINKYWGIYEFGQVQVYVHNDTLTKHFLIGSKLDSTDKFALYLQNSNRPLSFSGSGRIVGNAFLPEAGLRKSILEKNTYQYDEILVSGKKHPSKSELPKLDSLIVHSLLSHFDKFQFPAESLKIWNSIENNLNFVSFKDSPVCFYSENKIVLDNSYLKGAIILISEHSIKIHANSLLEDIILIAPVIHFEQKFQGSIQAFATDSIGVDNGVKLLFPSSLGIIQNDLPYDLTKSNIPSITLDSASMVQGVVFTIDNTSHTQSFESLIKIKNGAKVHGQVFASGGLELRGEVWGITYSKNFFLQTAASQYENFVLDGVMNVHKLSPHYLGSSLIQRKKIKGIAKWLE